MSLLIIIIAGFIIALLEFAPVSTNLMANLVTMFSMAEEADAELFYLMLKCGVLLGLIICFRKQLSDMVKGFLSVIKDLFAGRISRRELESSEMLSMLSLEALIPIPFFWVIHSLFDSVSRNAEVAGEGIAFIITAAMLLGSRMWKANGNKSISKMEPGDAILLGLLQCFSVIPGISRCAVTVSYPIMRGYEKYQSFLFSFIIYIPYLFLTIVRDIIVKWGMLSAAFGGLRYFIGAAVAACAAALSVMLFKKIFSINKYHWFAYLNLFIGITLIISAII